MLHIYLENTDFMQRAISQLQEGMDETTLNDIGEVMGKALGTFAPYDPNSEGVHLRDDYRVDFTKKENSVRVVWGYRGAPTRPYAHYQNEGVVYGPNIPDFREHGMWTDKFVSLKRGKGSKQSTGRMMGKRATIVLKDGRVIFIKGYSTPGTGDHWIEKARKTPEVYNPMRREIYETLALAIGEKIVGKRYYR